MTNCQLLLLALIPTVLIELTVLVLLHEKRKRILGASAVINILTNIPLNLFILFVNHGFITIALGEIIVLIVEALWYYLFLRDFMKSFVYSFLCNSISFLTGLFAQLLFVYFQHIK
jgi:hypothetical protein